MDEEESKSEVFDVISILIGEAADGFGDDTDDAANGNEDEDEEEEKTEEPVPREIDMFEVGEETETVVLEGTTEAEAVETEE